MLTFKEAEALYERAKDKTKGKKIAHATYLRKSYDTYRVKYHDTDIIVIHPDRYMLDSGM